MPRSSLFKDSIPFHRKSTTILLASASLIYTSQTFNTPFFKCSLIIKRIFNSYSPLSHLSYLNCIFEWPNCNLLFCFLIIEGCFSKHFTISKI
ncbi:CEQ_1a_G0015340.mRNA.1.CDS.1 [Saccharomyces cerevisiae]|nr:CEQ_1a_G0015340.mRNA.1.CDS.1 [Saccharomyces cerevisiae]CAI7260973.1 CEQ_1a_G0015340.mRNA.1.CDS.1 [Saccharomyces cerevisiae]